MKRNWMNQLLVATATTATLAAGSAWADDDGDGLPHVAVAEETSGEIVLEFAIELGFDDTTTPPTINLAAPVYDGFFGGYRTEPLAPSLPNSDLGFVSELEATGEEDAIINADVVILMLSKDANFETWFAGSQILSDASPEYSLGNQFDRHPTWVVTATEGDLSATASASFEVYDVKDGGIGTGNEVSLGQFDVTISVPEPTSGLLMRGCRPDCRPPSTTSLT